jgi:archaellum component FlaC
LKLNIVCIFLKELFDGKNTLSVCNERLKKMSHLVEKLSSSPSQDISPLKSCVKQYQSQLEAIAGEVKKQKSLLEYRVR